MKKQIASFILCSIAALFLLPACQKDDNNNPPASKTKTELISQSTWKFSNATVGGSDVSAALQSCQKDNIMTFVAAGTGTVDEGPTKCNAADPQSNPFTWNFQTNETILFISTPLFTGGSSTFTLVSLSETQMVVSQMITVGGSAQNAVVTFIH